MKKTLCILIAIGILISCSTSAFANSDQPDTARSIINSSLSNELTESIMQIPVFLTYIDKDEYDKEDIRQSANQALNTEYNNNHSENILSRNLSPITINESKYTVIEVSEIEKNILLDNPVFYNTFKRCIELIEQGTTVHYINLFVPDSFNIFPSRGNEDDPLFWENMFPPLCPNGGSNVYNGYKFLYMESSVNVETNPAIPNNISSMNWTSIVAKTAKIAADIFVKNIWYRIASVGYELLSAVFNGYTPPYSVTYSSASGYLKLWVSGDLYLRTILISDNLDRIPGYAYYGWGHLESFKSKTKADAKWPISVRPGGTTYNYETRTFTYPYWNIVNTPGFNGNTTLYQSVKSLYENTIGYFTHDEIIDVEDVITSLLS